MNSDDRRKRVAAVILIALLAVVILFALFHGHDVTVEVEGEGTADPSGTMHVRHGDSLEISVEPADGWVLSGFSIDGRVGSSSYVSDGDGGTITLSGICRDAHVRLVFERMMEEHTLTVTTGDGGRASPSGTSEHPEGTDVRVGFDPDEGYVVRDVILDGVSVGPRNELTVTMGSDHAVEVVFDGSTDGDVWVTVSADVRLVVDTGAEYGSISPEGRMLVAYGGSLTVTITLNEGYSLISVEVDGVERGPDRVFTIDDIVRSIEIAALIEHRTAGHVIAASSTSGGSISPSGEVTVGEGNDITFRASASPDCTFMGFEVDGEAVDSGPEYTFAGVSSDHSIRAVFGPNAPEKVLVSISPVDPPTRCYLDGSIGGTVRIRAVYDDGTVEIREGTCSQTSWTSPGIYTVEASYGGKSCTFDVVVPALTGISITTPPDSTSFEKGAVLDLTGMVVTASYDDGSQRVVAGYDWDPGSFADPGEHDVTVTYREGEVSESALQTVRIGDTSGFEVTVVSYSGSKNVGGEKVLFSETMSTPLPEFGFEATGMTPGMAQTVGLKIENRTLQDLQVCIFVDGFTGSDVLAEQIVLSCGGSSASVEDVRGGRLVSLGVVDSLGSSETELTMTFVNRSDNNEAMGQSLTFTLGVFAGDPA